MVGDRSHRCFPYTSVFRTWSCVHAVGERDPMGMDSLDLCAVCVSIFSRKLHWRVVEWTSYSSFRIYI